MDKPIRITVDDGNERRIDAHARAFEHDEPRSGRATLYFPGAVSRRLQRDLIDDRPELWTEENGSESTEQ